VPLLLVLFVKLAAAARAGEPLGQKLHVLLSGLGGILQALLVPLVVLVVALRALQQQGAAATGVGEGGTKATGCKEE
jgi:hypothetical protein